MTSRWFGLDSVYLNRSYYCTYVKEFKILEHLCDLTTDPPRDVGLAPSFCYYYFSHIKYSLYPEFGQFYEHAT
jgi:hypothetical protein